MTLLSGYRRMLERLKSMDEASLEHRFDEAKKTAHEMKEHTQEEIDQIAGYLGRDLSHAITYFKESGEEFTTWLGFDIELLEDRLWDAFSAVADPTLLDQMSLQFRLQRGRPYHTGQISGLGTLQCDACGEILSFHKPGHVPPCPKCHGDTFSRLPMIADSN